MASFEITSNPSALMPRVFAQLILVIFGAALVVSAFVIWLVPTAAGLPEVTLLKMGVSVFTLIGGLCCIVLAKEARR